MHRVHYAGGSVLTGDAIAGALLEYAAALARKSSSATVEIPVREPDGNRGIAQVLIGPASQLVSTHEQSETNEIEDDELVKRFELATRRLATPVGAALPEGQAPLPSTEFDLPFT